MAAPKGNKNAVKWDLDLAIKLFEDAIIKSNEKEYYIISGKKVKGYSCHFLGEIARQLDTYFDVFEYLAKTFPECEDKLKQLKRNCESNCFSDSKKGIIKEATAIMNLKSNYAWTDRTQTDLTTNGKDINVNPIKWTE